MSEGRILVVDDEPQIQRFLKPALVAAGYDPLLASSAAEAERLAATAAPDLIILDLGLPDKDGKDVIRSLRSWSKLPIVVLSARDQEAEKIEAFCDMADARLFGRESKSSRPQPLGEEGNDGLRIFFTFTEHNEVIGIFDQTPFTYQFSGFVVADVKGFLHAMQGDIRQ